MKSKNTKYLKKFISILMTIVFIVVFLLQDICYAYVPHTAEEHIELCTEAIEEIFENDDFYIKEKLYQCDMIVNALIQKSIKDDSFSFFESINIVFSLYKTYIKCMLKSLRNYDNWAIDKIYISTDIVVFSFYLFGFFIPSQYISFWVKV